MRPVRLVFVLLFSTALTVALPVKPAAAQVEVRPAPQPESTVPRFEGYLYLDVAGEPLPFQSDAEIEAFLREAEIGDMVELGTGVTRPKKVELLGDGFRAHAIFKNVDERKMKVSEVVNGRKRFSLLWRDWHGYDTAAYVLDRSMGLDRVPPAVRRRIRGADGTIRIWLEGTVTEAERSLELGVSPPDSRRWVQQRSMAQVFDNLVANRDSNLGNLLIDSNWRLWLIDCSRCFGRTKEMYYPLEHIDHCERGLWEGLKNLDRERVEGCLSPYLGRAEIDALMARRDRLVEHFQALIDQRGEAGVLYEVLPQTERAPWGVRSVDPDS